MPHAHIPHKVLACIDHSGYATIVCDYAAWAAKRLGAPLELVHVLDRHPETAQQLDFSGSIGLGAQENLLQQLALVDEQRSQLAQEAGRHLVAAARQHVLAAGVTQIEGRQVRGELSSVLAATQDTTRLFVMGKYGETGGRDRQSVGGNLERVARAVQRPLLVVSAPFKTPTSFMLAFDGGTTTRQGVDLLAASPLVQGLCCHLVMAGADNAANQAQIAWASHRLQAAGLTVTARLLPGAPESVLAAYAAEHDIGLLAMGAYGHSRLRQWLVGSTAAAMLRTAATPLLLLR